jgi:hypothetical protein
MRVSRAARHEHYDYGNAQIMHVSNPGLHPSGHHTAGLTLAFSSD